MPEPRPVLTHWSLAVPVGERQWGFVLPNKPGLVLRGVVTGHPRLPNNTAGFMSSTVRSAQGRTVTCGNRVYELVGPPDPDYIAWLSQQPDCPTFDWDNPILVRAGQPVPES